MPSTTKGRPTPSRQQTPRTKNLSSKSKDNHEADENDREGENADEQLQQERDEKEEESLSVTTKSKASRPHIAFADDTVGGEEDLDYDQDQNDSSKGPISTSSHEGVNGVLTKTGTANARGPKEISMRQRRRRRPGPSHNASSSTASPSAAPSSEWKRRKRGRVARMVHVATPVVAGPFTFLPTSSSRSSAAVFPLPGNQYSTVLRRRAIRKLEDKPLNGSNSHDSKNGDEYGDISLGMKLIVAGGKVIVQTLNALTDGRASPAQLTGVIQRGDVLIAVGEISLANLPIDQLMTGLKPLSSPETADGKYRRVLKLRLEAGAGLELLKSHERGLVGSTGGGTTTATAEAQAAVNDMFALFPMVDQLSGAPLLFQQPTFSQDYDEEPDNKKDEGDKELVEQPDSPALSSSQDDASARVDEKPVSPDELISAMLAKERTLDRERFTSEYFDWRNGFSKLLRAVDIHDKEQQQQQQQNHDNDDEPAIGAGLTKAERIDLGIQIMKLAKTLTYGMEDMDKGKDLRSFKMWSTNFSLRSSASARRRHIMDAASLRSHRTQTDTNDSDDIDDSIGSGSGSFGSVDGDALLLGLAAHDDIWRKQVLDALRAIIDKMESGQDNTDNHEDENAKEDEEPDDINTALQNQFGAFLFGENMNSIIKKKKKSFALPPEDITTVLFDLSTHIATAAPDEVTVFGGTAANSFSYQSSFGTTQGKIRSQLRADILLANRFILDEVLPLWLKSFRPLGPEHRRLFWPKLQRGSVGSYGGTMTHGGSDNDSLTVDSNGSPAKGTSRAATKNLQEMIEDSELDVETRAETCFLVTFYFTKQILAKYTSSLSEDDTAVVDKEVTSFVQTYGTYLQIHSCLAFSASVEAERAVDELLEVAKHDPSHREAVTEIQNAKSLTFYDVSKLTAVLQFLRNIRYENEQRRNVIKNLCVAAYPDVQPWQIKKACFDPSLAIKSMTPCKEATLSEFYYSYLSQLLDPAEGQEAARHSAKLIKEWCEYSTGVNSPDQEPEIDKAKLQNFYRVASRSSSAHLAYRRDLPTLLEMSMSIKEYDLALELTTEILEDRKLCSRMKTVRRVLICLREIGREGLAVAMESKENGSKFRTLKRVLRAFHQMSRSDFSSCRESISVPDELLTLLTEWEQKIKSEDGVSEILILVDFMIHESAPVDVLSALVLWSKSDELGPALFSRLDSLLRRGVQVALKSELSGSLLRLKYMRQGYTEENKSLMVSRAKEQDSNAGNGFWKRMSLGTLTVNK